MTVIVEESTITAKGQTTVPKAVRQALGVDSGDRIAFRIDERGVTVERAGVETEDPAIGPFLQLLARDMEQRPEALRALTPEFAARIAELTRSVDVDPDAPIEGEVAF
jgi:antitoxin PrlF